MPDRNHEQAVWEYLEGHYPKKVAARQRAEIETRVLILRKQNKDPAKIYAALAVGVRLLKAHKSRLRSNEIERSLATRQRRVWRDLGSSSRLGGSVGMGASAGRPAGPGGMRHTARRS